MPRSAAVPLCRPTLPPPPPPPPPHPAPAALPANTTSSAVPTIIMILITAISYIFTVALAITMILLIIIANGKVTGAVTADVPACVFAGRTCIWKQQPALASWIYCRLRVRVQGLYGLGSKAIFLDSLPRVASDNGSS